ncbi:trichoplein keratin filament-binding protein-like [Genypterus blacodes]|uniref:trichoplein keratin filament-binding protein-like n=1 Tax=Genypterus blacodes TaxID=154954 RepID=UPI003F760AD8
MARPIAHAPSRSRVLAAQMARHREQETRLRRQWELNAQYHRQQAVNSQRYHVWNSARSYQQSMSAYNKQRLKEEERMNLERRRDQLRAMLQVEQDQLEAELRDFLPNSETFAGQLMQRTKALRLAREGRHKKLVEETMKEQWRKTDPELREVTTALHTDHVVSHWKEQISNKTQQEAAEQEEGRRFENECERTRIEALERQKQAEEKKKADERKRAEDLAKQMEELRMSEEAATHLKKEEDALQLQQWQLGNIEEERRKAEEHRKKSEIGHFLHRQYRAQLKRRAQKVQEELEADRQILTALTVGEVEDQKIKSVQRARTIADAAYMKHVIEEQLQMEREREADFENLQREHAQKLWEKREAAWEKERKARERLMQEVLAGRQQQVELKMQRNHEAQEEILRRREELIQELETERESRRKEREQAGRLRTERMREINVELEQRRQEVLEEQCRLEQEKEDDREALRNQEEELRLEREKMAKEGYQEKVHRRQRSAWM